MKDFYHQRQKENNVAASGVRSCALSTLLVHESPRCGNLALNAGRLRDGLADDLDCGAVLTVRMGRTIAVPQLQMSFAGRLPSGRCVDWRKQNQLLFFSYIYDRISKRMFLFLDETLFNNLCTENDASIGENKLTSFFQLNHKINNRNDFKTFILACEIDEFWKLIVKVNSPLKFTLKLLGRRFRQFVRFPTRENCRLCFRLESQVPRSQQSCDKRVTIVVSFHLFLDLSISITGTKPDKQFCLGIEPWVEKPRVDIAVTKSFLGQHFAHVDSPVFHKFP